MVYWVGFTFTFENETTLIDFFVSKYCFIRLESDCNVNTDI